VDDPGQAWNLIRGFGRVDELIVVAGSFFLAAEMRRAVRAAFPSSERLATSREAEVTL
jgi:hypothetical protein